MSRTQTNGTWRTAALAGAIWLAGAAVAPSAGAATISVGIDGAPDAPSVSAGVALASDGDTVSVSTGAYIEVVSTNKALTIVAADGAGTVSINAQNFGPALSFVNVNGAVRVEGLALENGGGTRGGGLFLSGVTGGVIVEDCEFYGNLTSTSGGAIDAYDTVVEVRNCTFDGNGVQGASEQRGGAIHLREFTDGSVIEDCTFANNQADYGGSIWFRGACTIRNCSFADGNAEKGGAIYGQTVTSATVHLSTFDTTTSTDNGGALHFSGANVDVRYCLFEDCTSGTNGGAIYLGGGSNTSVTYNTFDSCIAVKGGGIAVAGMLQTLYRNTFYGCRATTSGAAAYVQQGSADISQNIFTASTASAAFMCESTATPSLTCNLFWNNPVGHASGCSDPVGSDGNFDDDPEFCDASDDDFRIHSDSVAGPDAGPSECDGAGIGSGGIGCGVTAVEHMSWGAIKARF